MQLNRNSFIISLSSTVFHSTVCRVSKNSGMDYWNEFLTVFVCLLATLAWLSILMYIFILVIPSLKSVYDTKNMCTM